MLNKTLVASFALALLSLAAPALAGPPFICHQFEIGSAASLPWTAGDWLGMSEDYDITRVVADTERLLTPSTPTLVRMETLRRAVLYASRDRALATQLVTALVSKARAADEARQPDALASFDAGYVVEAMYEIEQASRYDSDLADRGRLLAGLTGGLDPQPLLLRAASLRPNDGTISFALALISKTEARQPHLLKARAGAQQDRLLATNMVRLQMLQ